MKRTLFSLFIFLLVAPLSLAQEVTRVVILPFSVSSSNGAYELGLAAALQRSLNVIDNVYAPPIGDTFLYIRKLIEDDNVSTANIADAFEAQTVVSGQLSGEGGAGTVLLGFAGPTYPEVKNVSVSVSPDDPDALVSAVAEAIVSELQLGLSGEDRQEFTEVNAQIPSVPSLSAVGQGALRLPTTTLTQLESAVQLDADSSWVQSEYARALALASDNEAALEASLRATELAPNDAEAWAVRGIVLQASGEREGAENAFDTALMLNPAHAYALVGKGTLTGDAALLQAASEAYPRMVDAYVALAELQSQSNPQQALQTLRRGAAAVPESVTLHRNLLNSALTLGDGAGAVSYLRNEVLARQTNPSPALYGLAAMLPDAQGAEALGIVQEGLGRYPSNPVLARAEAELLERQGNRAGAVASLSAALAANPSSIEVANDLALLQAKEGDLEAARSTLTSVTGQNETVQFNLGQLYLQSGQAEAALEALEPLAQTRPDDAEVQALYGIALARLGRIDEARAALDTAITLDPAQENALRARALLSQEQALTGGEAIELSPEAAAAFNEGKSALEASNYTDAAAAFSRARDAQDEGIIAFYQAYSLYFSGRTRAAADAYIRAAEAFPESDIVLNNLGLAQIELGRYDLALDNLARAVSLNPDNANAHLNLGLANYELGRYAAAVTEWEQAIALDSSLVSAIADRLDDAKQKSQ